jgi:flagellar biosynthesis protein FlhG
MASMTWTSAGGGREAGRGASAPAMERAAQGEARLGSGRCAPRIWAIGGGKGGVGKSVVSTNLAAAIAGAGRRCAVIDADLGGANLHTLLGVSRPRYSLSHLLTGDVSHLADLMVQTSVPNLWLVSGNQALLEMANPSHSQRELLVRQIRGLDVDDVVLDLGAGSAFTVLDFFLLARRGLVVVTPEPTAIENAEHFIRAAFYRSLREVARRPDVAAAIRRLRENGRARKLHSAGQLIALVRAIDPPAAKPLEDRAQAFAPLLVVNQVQTSEHRGVGPRIVASCRERLGAAIEFAGSIDSDPNVAAAVARRQPALQAFPLCRFSRHIEALAERLQRGDADVPREREEESGHASRVAASAPAAGGAARAPGVSGDVASPPHRLPPLDRAEPGAYLRRCREALGLSLADMTERTRIRTLDQIEDERFDLLPPEPYLKGYLFEYARALGLPDIMELAKCYLAKTPAPGTQGAPRAAPALAPRRRVHGWRG